MHSAVKKAVNAAIPYSEYVNLVVRLVEIGATSGTYQSERLTYYTRLNLKRMQRLNKTVQVDAKLVDLIGSFPIKTKWIVITEAWCGDAAQNIPYIAKLAELAGIEMGLVFRDEHPAFMERYLTGQSRSIPKMIVFQHQSMHELGTWGPRPEVLQQMVMDYRAQTDHKLDFDNFAESIHRWYADNKCSDLERELHQMFTEIKTNHTAKTALT